MLLDSLATENYTHNFIHPRKQDPLRDTAWGGVHLRDITQGLLVYLWTYFYVDNKLYIQRGSDTPTILLTYDGITHISGTFDQNMNPCVIFKTDTNATVLYWFNTLTGKQEYRDFDSGLEYPHVSLDDHRSFNTPNSDIILSYIREDKLCVRVQRDRFNVEYILKDVPNMKLTQTGMTRNLRFRWRYVHKKQGE